MIAQDVFVTGGTGYVGQALVRALLRRGHHVRVLTRPASASRVPPGARPILGDALNPASYAHAVRPDDTFVHLVGTPHPSPAKSAEFRRVDLPSIEAAVEACQEARVPHLVYVSVAHPAPVMQAFIHVRVAGEVLIENAGLTATIVRPWYVLGPGHRWPLMLVPLYAIAGRLPMTRAAAHRLGLVTLVQMVDTLVAAVEHPPAPRTRRIVEVPDIRQSPGAVVAV